MPDSLLVQNLIGSEKLTLDPSLSKLVIEVDDREDGLNAGQTSFVYTDSIGFLVYATTDLYQSSSTEIVLAHSLQGIPGAGSATINFIADGDTNYRTVTEVLKFSRSNDFFAETTYPILSTNGVGTVVGSMFVDDVYPTKGTTIGLNAVNEVKLELTGLSFRGHTFSSTLPTYVINSIFPINSYVSVQVTYQTPIKQALLTNLPQQIGTASDPLTSYPVAVTAYAMTEKVPNYNISSFTQLALGGRY